MCAVDALVVLTSSDVGVDALVVLDLFRCMGSMRLLYLTSSDVPLELNFLLFTLRLLSKWVVEPDRVGQHQRTRNVVAMLLNFLLMFLSFFDDLIVELIVVIALVVDDIVVNLCNLLFADDVV